MLIVPLALAGCGSSQIQACEDQLIAKLKSPASYKRISAETVRIDESIHKPPYDSVTITYDAANSFNALLRDKEYCSYRPGTTEVVDPFANLTDESAIDNTLDENMMFDDANVTLDEVSNDDLANSTGE